MILAEVAPAGTERREVVGQPVEAAEGDVAGRVLAVAAARQRDRCLEVEGGAPDEELTLHEVLVDAVVAPGGRGDLGSVVECAVSPALGILDVLFLGVDHEADLLVEVDLVDTLPGRWAHALVGVVAGGSVGLCEVRGLVETRGGRVQEVGRVHRGWIAVESGHVRLNVLPGVGEDVIADEGVVEGLVLSDGGIVAEGVSAGQQCQRQQHNVGSVLAAKTHTHTRSSWPCMAPLSDDASPNPNSNPHRNRVRSRGGGHFYSQHLGGAFFRTRLKEGFKRTALAPLSNHPAHPAYVEG